MNRQSLDLTSGRRTTALVILTMLLHQSQPLEGYRYFYRKEIRELFLSSIVHKTQSFQVKNKKDKDTRA